MKIDRRAADWGLASLGITTAFLIMAPIMLIFNDFYWSIGIHHADRDEIDAARIVTPLVGGAFLVLIGFGIFCGFRGLSVARTTRQAAALPLAGIVVGFLDLVLWLGLLINLLAILGTFL
jgi:CBS domain containing-hemolysin-like protein